MSNALWLLRLRPTQLASAPVCAAAAIHLRSGDLPQDAWLETTMQLMRHEAQASRPGAQAVVNRLVGVLFVQMVQRYFAQQPQKAGVLAGMADRHVGKSLELMHRSPQSA